MQRDAATQVITNQISSFLTSVTGGLTQNADVTVEIDTSEFPTQQLSSGWLQTSSPTGNFLQDAQGAEQDSNQTIIEVTYIVDIAQEEMGQQMKRTAQIKNVAEEAKAAMKIAHQKGDNKKFIKNFKKMHACKKNMKDAKTQIAVAKANLQVAHKAKMSAKKAKKVLKKHAKKVKKVDLAIYHALKKVQKQTGVKIMHKAPKKNEIKAHKAIALAKLHRRMKRHAMRVVKRSAKSVKRATKKAKKVMKKKVAMKHKVTKKAPVKKTKKMAIHKVLKK